MNSQNFLRKGTPKCWKTGKFGEIRWKIIQVFLKNLLSLRFLTLILNYLLLSRYIVRKSFLINHTRLFFTFIVLLYRSETNGLSRVYKSLVAFAMECRKVWIFPRWTFSHKLFNSKMYASIAIGMQFKAI